MDIHPEDIIISIINIIILFILLRLILWKPVVRYLASRTARISNQFKNAEDKEQEAKSLLLEYNEKIDKLEERDREMIQKSKELATKEAGKILDKAHHKATNLLEDAENRISMEKEQAIEEAHEEVTKLATEMAARILHREISVSDNENVVKDFFKKKTD